MFTVETAAHNTTQAHTHSPHYQFGMTSAAACARIKQLDLLHKFPTHFK